MTVNADDQVEDRELSADAHSMWLAHLDASRRLAEAGGTEPDIESIRRFRADDPTPERHAL